MSVLVTTVRDFRRCVTADFYKLKRTPVWWLALGGGAFVAVFVFLIYYFLVDEFQGADANPWNNYVRIGFTMISMLLVTPYAVLLTAAVLYPEHQARAWKWLHTLPLPPTYYYLAKLLVTLGLVTLTYVVFFLTLLAGGYLLSILLPQLGFQEYTPAAGRLLGIVARSFVSLLGLTALQFWLSYRYRNIIVPIGVGLLGFIIGLVSATKTQAALYFPYCYPVYTSLLLESNDPESAGLPYWGSFLQTEWLSVGYFLVFTAVGVWGERIRD
jgi:hypothetical protein